MRSQLQRFDRELVALLLEALLGLATIAILVALLRRGLREGDGAAFGLFCWVVLLTWWPAIRAAIKGRSGQHVRDARADPRREVQIDRRISRPTRSTLDRPLRLPHR